jgi:acetyl-CoA carboxylase biotin carboxylase subunit
MQKILIANRGEIAVRLIRTCREMGIATVAVYSKIDENAIFVKMADEAVCIGESTATESYLNTDKIIAACKHTNADAVHPGYGFLAENAVFAQRCQEEGIVFIGPSPEVIALMGSKSEAKKCLLPHNIPMVVGYQGVDQSFETLEQEANKIGFPLLIKASAGGGGKGMRIVRTAAAFATALESAQREAKHSFGDDTILLERYFEAVRHIEFQLFGDKFGNIVHLFERECSIQRRHQKVIEEAPSAFLTPELRARMGATAVQIGQIIHYTNAGTVEFIADEEGNYYFLEINTRLQVEHPVTELITGLDLVRLQIEIAQGKPLALNQDEIQSKGYAIEFRICAENPRQDFQPQIGQLLTWNHPESARLDSGVVQGTEISPYYDSMLAKLIVWGEDRQTAIRKSALALQQCTTLGISSNLDFLYQITQEPDFQTANINTHYIENHPILFENLKPTPQEIKKAALTAFLHCWYSRAQQRRIVPKVPSGWRNNFYQPLAERLEVDDAIVMLSYQYTGNQCFLIQIGEDTEKEEVTLLQIKDALITFEYLQQRQQALCIQTGNSYWIKIGTKQLTVKYLSRLPEKAKAIAKGNYEATMPAEIVKILVVQGQAVEIGMPLVVMNSMKMENTIYAHSSGIVREIFVTEKTNVKSKTPLLSIS